MSLIVPVNAGQEPYNIHITNSFGELTSLLEEVGISPTTKIGIITDSNVEKHQLHHLIHVLDNHNISVFSFKAGEKSKNFETVQNLYKQLVDNEFDRHCCLIALGGGVVGDITGFVASTYMRGLSYIQVPTSLLAQVDSSVGGKTGYDFMGYKNMIGTFYQPKLVYINLSTLNTLPEKEFNAGMAEVIKHGIIIDRSYLDFLINEKAVIKDLDDHTLSKMISGSCKIKASVVSKDEKEMGIREILNYGHTLGHAIESVYHFKYLHGECVALGIKGAAYMSYKLGSLSKGALEDIESLLSYFDLPSIVNDLDTEKVNQSLYHDKKVKEGKIKFIINDNLGCVKCRLDIPKELIEEALYYLKGVI